MNLWRKIRVTATNDICSICSRPLSYLFLSLGIFSCVIRRSCFTVSDKGAAWAVTHKPVLVFASNQKPHNIVRFAYHTSSMLSQIFLVLRLFFCVKTASHLKEMIFVHICGLWRWGILSVFRRGIPAKMCEGRSLRHYCFTSDCPLQALWQRGLSGIDDFTLSHIIFCSHRLKNHLIFNIVYYTYRFSSAGYKKQQQPLTILKRVVQDKTCD